MFLTSRKLRKISKVSFDRLFLEEKKYACEPVRGKEKSERENLMDNLHIFRLHLDAERLEMDRFVFGIIRGREECGDRGT